MAKSQPGRPLKKYSTIAPCGLDCGLCPRYYTIGVSRCPGCCGAGFFDKHPGCSIVTCCVKRKGLEVCAWCAEFPCLKFASWTGEGESAYDSFLTHRKALPNLEFIREHGLGEFVGQQQRRIVLLERMIGEFDDGRSKSFYCLAATLLSIAALEESLGKAARKVEVDGVAAADIKSRAKLLKEALAESAGREGIELKLRKKNRVPLRGNAMP